MLEYVAMGDHATAVAFLLAATPERSARYYRDALCTLALAVSHHHHAFKSCSGVQEAQSCYVASWKCFMGLPVWDLHCWSMPDTGAM